MDKIMTELSLKIVSRTGEIRCEECGAKEVHLVYFSEYEEGDQIVLELSKAGQHLIIQADDALGTALVYLTKTYFTYQIPFGEKRICYSPKVFAGDKHYLYARFATLEEVKAYRNLAQNPMDQHGESGCYPHASANVETRGEAVFAARNAIDGIRENRSHGEWPYGSWGINRQPDASFTLNFGREILADKIVLYTRADFPHDNWWKQVTFTFSDGSETEFLMQKSVEPHILKFEKKQFRSLTMSHLIPSEEPSPFPALTQIEVYGTEIGGENEIKFY